MKRICVFIACAFILFPVFSGPRLEKAKKSVKQGVEQVKQKVNVENKEAKDDSTEEAKDSKEAMESKESSKDDKPVIADIGIQEFVNVTTKFEFTSRDDAEKITKIYGSLEPSKVDYKMPVYDAKDEVYLTLSFTPSVLKAFEKDLKLSKKQLKELEIPVLVEISEASEVQIMESSGVLGIKELPSDDSKKISFTIKNDDSSDYSVKLSIKSSRLGKNDKSKSCQVFVNYRNENNKIVDKTCEVFQTITFKKNK